MSEKPWWRQLDGQPPSPAWWTESVATRIGLIGTVIFGGGALFRLAFADQLGGLAWLWGLLTLPFVVLLVVGLRSGGDRP